MESKIIDKNKLENAFNMVVKYGFCGDCRWKTNSEVCHEYDCYQRGVKLIRDAVDFTIRNKKKIVYEVVYSERYLDVGLLIERDNKLNPKRIKTRTYSYMGATEYGSVENIKWINTGIFLSEDEWDKITYNKPTNQILDELKIKW